MQASTIVRRGLVGVLASLGLGLAAGGLEAVMQSWVMVMPLGVVGLVLSTCVSGLLLGVFAASAAFVFSVVHWSWRDHPMHAAAAQVSVATFATAAAYLWSMAAMIVSDGGPILGVIPVVLMPVGFAGVAYFNARYWLRRVDRAGYNHAVFVAAGAIVMILCGVLVGIGHGQRDTGGTHALEGDRSMLLVTIDGYAHEQAHRAQGFVVFEQAISPTSELRAGHAAVLLGLHPLRARVLSDADPVASGHRALAEVLEKEGYATAAFVSSSVLRRESGLAQGFRTFDDDVLGRWAHGAAVRKVLSLVGLMGDRTNAKTIAGYQDWLGEHQDLPSFAWVQLIGEGGLDDLLEQTSEETQVIVVGTRGRARGLKDDAVRVGLSIRGNLDEQIPVVASQIRTTDLTNTALDLLGFDAMERSEGIPLKGYMSGRRKATLWTALVGRDDKDNWLLGIRNNGVKVIWPPAGSTEAPEIYELAKDPSEERSLVDDKVLKAAERLIGADRVALQELAP